MTESVDRVRQLLQDPSHAVALYSPQDQGSDFLLRHVIQPGQAPLGTEPLPGRRVSEADDAQHRSGLLQLLRQVWLDGGIECRPLRRYRDGRLVAWGRQTALRLPEGEVVVVTEDLTALRRREQELTQTNETLQTIIDGMPSFVYVADLETYEILFLNRCARDAYGEVIGLPCWQALHDREEGPCDFCPMAKSTDPVGDLETPRVREVNPPKTQTWLEYRFQAIPWTGERPACLAVVNDISDRKRQEQELRIIAQSLDTTHGVMVTDAQGDIVKVNRTFCEMTGYGAQEAIGASPRMLKSERNAPEVYEELWNGLLSDGHWRGSLWNRRKDGEHFPSDVSITAIHSADGETSHYVAHCQDISEQMRFQAQMERQALYDALTDLPNRRLLLDRLEKRLSEASRHGNLGSLMFLDLDNFKQYNDRLGHAAGDAILREAARRITGCVRQEDTVARFGGDEFVVLLFNLGETPVAARVHALEVAGKIRRRLIRSVPYDGERIDIRTSIGITLFPSSNDRVDDIIGRADQAMYRAKRAGKNCIRLSPL